MKIATFFAILVLTTACLSAKATRVQKTDAVQLSTNVRAGANNLRDDTGCRMTGKSYIWRGRRRWYRCNRTQCRNIRGTQGGYCARSASGRCYMKNRIAGRRGRPSGCSVCTCVQAAGR